MELIHPVKYISKEGLDNIRKYYKYSAEDHSLCVKYFLRAFWEFLLPFIPIWVAPNLITMTGFSIILLNFFTLLFFSPNLHDPVPSWVLLTFIVGIFIYQTLDNLDGKQARRTGSSSVLGELFDHGCDSLFVTVSGITLWIAMNMTPWRIFMGIVCLIVPFYGSHWEEWHTGTLILSKSSNPTEGQLIMCIVHFSTYFTGSDWWWVTIRYVGAYHWFPFIFTYEQIWWVPNIYCNTLFLVVFSTGDFFGLIENGKKALAAAKEKGIPTLKVFLILFPVTIDIVFSALWYYFSSNNIIENYTSLCIFSTGLLASYSLDRLMVNRVSRMEFNIFFPLYYTPVLGLIIALFFPQYEIFYLILSFILLVLAYFHFAVFIVRELCDFLNIKCFKIVPKVTQK
eukprot:TRINITY_DN248_c2_g1_i1.p1 TRINITY_DN248_c2_g1~~TRINITY_DN248_c2_g1_i1.p1  ORF type:complete len:397 (-),score=80.78 TRINITY_DN248_c2_g1_i1:105-1295(-)